jgi:hypothetical protein
MRDLKTKAFEHVLDVREGALVETCEYLSTRFDMSVDDHDFVSDDAIRQRAEALWTEARTAADPALAQESRLRAVGFLLVVAPQDPRVIECLELLEPSLARPMAEALRIQDRASRQRALVAIAIDEAVRLFHPRITALWIEAVLQTGDVDRADDALSRVLEDHGALPTLHHLAIRIARLRGDADLDHLLLLRDLLAGAADVGVVPRAVES